MSATADTSDTATRRRRGPGPTGTTAPRGHVPRPRAVTALLVVATLVTTVLLAGCAGRTGAGGAAPGSAGTVATASAPPTGSSSAPAGGPAVSASPSKASPLARSVPVRLEIPGIGVDTSVMPLGLAADGSVAVPPIEAHSPAGWYQGSPAPGQVGPSVILGHVTVGQFGDGVFLHLDRMKAGDRVVVVLKDGESAVFSVDSVQTVAKTRFPTDSVYGNVDHPALRLITCGGTRESGGGGYPDNVVVYASLVSTT